MHLRSKRLRLAGVAAAAAVSLLAAGCSSSSSSPSSSSTGGTPVKGGTATVAVVAGTQANWIFPFMSLQYFSVYNSQYFQYMMYRPLYYFGGENNQPTVNYTMSPADAPVFSNGGKTVTINMKGWKWSNGETVDANDVVFWLHMMYAEGANWAGTSPGGIPQNITSISTSGPNTVVLTLNKAYSSSWYTYNELSQVTPMPMAWDVTSAGAAAGSGGCTTDSAADKWAKCVAVYNYLTAQAKDTSTYVSSPLWSVVDGPWKLSVFNTSGADTLVPNPKYSGPQKPYLSAVQFVPYTTEDAAFTAEQSSSGPTIGFIPSEDLPIKPVSQVLPSTNPLSSEGYYLTPAYGFAFNYYQINYHNPTYGPLFKQLYFRQVLEYLDDQNGMAKSIYRGYGYPTTGPAPTEPNNQWVPAVQEGQGPYPYNPAKAEALLTSHGWKKGSNGIDTCTNASLCGVKAGTPLQFNFDYTSGTPVFTQEAQIYKSALESAGIGLTITAQSFNTIIGEAVPCSGSKCTWEMAMYGGWIYSPDYEPTGEELFATGAGSNGGSYSDPTMDSLINQTTTSSSLTVYHNFATYAAQQLPFIYMPNSYAVDAVKSTLHGFIYNPLDAFVPEYWYFTKKS